MTPAAKRNTAMLEEYEGGATVSELMAKYDLTQATVNHALTSARTARRTQEERTNWDRDFKETVVLMRKYGVPVNFKTKRRCFDMTERAIRLLGKYYKDKEYYEEFGDPV